MNLWEPCHFECHLIVCFSYYYFKLFSALTAFFFYISYVTFPLNSGICFSLTVTFCGKGPSGTMYYTTKSMFDLFLDKQYKGGSSPFTFKDSFQIEDIWGFLEYVMLDGIYWESWYDVQQSPTLEDDRNILYQNYVLGVPRIRQVCSDPKLPICAILVLKSLPFYFKKSKK